MPRSALPWFCSLLFALGKSLESLHTVSRNQLGCFHEDSCVHRTTISNYPFKKLYANKKNLENKHLHPMPTWTNSLNLSGKWF